MVLWDPSICSFILRAHPMESSFNSHSQTTKTFHPNFSKSFLFLASLCLLFSNLVFQNSTFDLGRERLHAGHLCQKHPFTNMAILLLGYTISGFPGIFPQCFRYPRRPTALKAALIVFSGFVSFPLFARITLEIRFGLEVVAIRFLPLLLHLLEAFVAHKFTAILLLLWVIKLVQDRYVFATCFVLASHSSSSSSGLSSSPASYSIYRFSCPPYPNSVSSNHW